MLFRRLLISADFQLSIDNARSAVADEERAARKELRKAIVSFQWRSYRADQHFLELQQEECRRREGTAGLEATARELVVHSGTAMWWGLSFNREFQNMFLGRCSRFFGGLLDDEERQREKLKRRYEYETLKHTAPDAEYIGMAVEADLSLFKREERMRALILGEEHEAISALHASAAAARTALDLFGAPAADGAVARRLAELLKYTKSCVVHFGPLAADEARLLERACALVCKFAEGDVFQCREGTVPGQGPDGAERLLTESGVPGAVVDLFEDLNINPSIHHVGPPLSAAVALARGAQSLRAMEEANVAERLYGLFANAFPRGSVDQHVTVCSGVVQFLTQTTVLHKKGFSDILAQGVRFVAPMVELLTLFPWNDVLVMEVLFWLHNATTTYHGPAYIKALSMCGGASLLCLLIHRRAATRVAAPANQGERSAAAEVVAVKLLHSLVQLPRNAVFCLQFGWERLMAIYVDFEKLGAKAYAPSFERKFALPLFKDKVISEYVIRECSALVPSLLPLREEVSAVLTALKGVMGDTLARPQDRANFDVYVPVYMEHKILGLGDHLECKYIRYTCFKEQATLQQEAENHFGRPCALFFPHSEFGLLALSGRTERLFRDATVLELLAE